MNRNDFGEQVRIKAERCFIQGNAGRSFANYMLAINICPKWRDELKDNIISVLCSWGKNLESNQRYSDLFECYDQALESYPDSEELLTNLGAHLFRLGYINEATTYFRNAVSKNPEYLPAKQNLQNVNNCQVERWHFRMLNDHVRNKCYYDAIQNRINQGYTSLLDIGTGTGILSLFGHSGNARSIYACEVNPTMIKLAEQVFNSNTKPGEIKLIPKLSNDIIIPRDLPKRVNLITLETMDAGLLGENLLRTLNHALEYLLEHNGKIVPFAATIHAAIIQCDFIASKTKLLQEANDSIVKFITTDYEPYDSEHLKYVPGGFEYLTKSKAVFTINFNNLDEIKQCLSGKTFDVNFVCEKDGRVDAICTWFELFLDETISLSSSPESTSCWEQALYLIGDMMLRKGDNISIVITCKDILTFAIRRDTVTEQDKIKELNISSEDFQVLNDPKWYILISQLEEKYSQMELNILDLTAVPQLVLKLATTKNKMTYLSKSAYCDLIPKQMHAISMEDVDKLKDKFDVILIDPVCSSGVLNQDLIQRIPTLVNHLKANGIILPVSISVKIHLINCPYLIENHHVIDDSRTCGYKIAPYINQYKVEHHINLNLKSVPHTILSQETVMLTINLCEIKNIKQTLDIPIIKTGEIDAVLQWFELNFGNFTIETLDSHWCHTAFICNSKLQVEENDIVPVTVTFHNGLLNVEIKDK